MSISIFGSSIKFAEELITQLLIEEFELSKTNAKLLAKEVKPHFTKLKNTCYLVAETLYVDKVYRDSFYHYYSSKLNKYKRECVRVSIFDGEVVAEDFRKGNKIKELQEKFRGFIVLRPTEPYIIGRSVISPLALKSNTFACCKTNILTTVNAIKLYAQGFPHSSQDTETISCAETTIWALMEYFAHQYPEYKPVLPSEIIETLNKVTSERQVPSGGLDILQISFALKEFGFGTKIYSREEYKGDFEKVLSCYIESGIPLILDVNDYHADGSTGHAMICMGHEQITDKQIDSVKPNQIVDKELLKVIHKKNLSIYDWDTIVKDFVFVDDNCPVYQKAPLKKPVGHYPKSWHQCQINHFIAPLHSKIYLEACEAKDYVLRFLVTGPRPISPNTEMFVRFFLTSSKSYKNSLALDNSLDSDVKEMILEIPMPKFVWIAELSRKDLLKQKAKEANGLIILDATEANISDNKPLLFAAYQDNLIVKTDGKDRKFVEDGVSLRPFLMYNNLKTI